jgi:PAS domain S-box-containing protein
MADGLDASKPADASLPEGSSDAPPADEDIYRLLVESVRDYAIFALDPQGRIVTWNPGAERLKGYRLQEIVGRHFSVFYPDDAVARGKPAMELRIAAEYGRFEDEGWRVRKDGGRFWANVVITAIREPGTGKLLGFSKVTRDLTDRRQAEEELRQSEERFRLLVEGVQDYAIFLLDPTGHVQSWNKGAQRLKGYRPVEIIGEHISRFYLPGDVAKGLPERELEIAQRDGRYEDEGWRVRKDGSCFWANVVVAPLRDPRSGTLLGFSKVTRDLTTRKRHEDALHQAYRDMEAFGYTVSHDLRAPLRAIETLADFILRDGTFDPETRKNVESMRRSATDASTLVESLLRFSRANAESLRHEPVDLGILAQEVVARLREGSDHAVDFDLVDPADLVVQGDRALLRTMLENLLSNAWKFTRRAAGARVAFGLAPPTEDGARVFMVKDNGAGFDATRGDRLFQPFARLHAAKEYAGTGVGLATVRRIVERHGGRVWAESRPGEGATFLFTLDEAR